MSEYMSFPAVRAIHDSGREIFAFPIEGNDILKIASVSKFSRMDDGEIQGFQRGEAKQHITQIAEYVGQIDSMIPNAIVIAFNENEVVFEQSSEGEHGFLKVPYDPDSEHVPGLIVDGQQRTMGIKKAIEDEKSTVKRFPMMVCAFLESDLTVQQKHFILLNQSKNLPSTLIDELLPGAGLIGTKWDARRFSSQLIMKLEDQEDCPFYQLIKTQGRTGGKITRNSLLNPYKRMFSDERSFIGKYIENGMFIGDLDELVEEIKTYWIAVQETFNEAWDPDLKKSRIMHGTALYALAQLQDVIKNNSPLPLTLEEYKKGLSKIQPYCHWTEEDGDWLSIHLLGNQPDEPWNFFENTEKDKKLLTGYLVRKFGEQVY
jgi:DGQHR domain-containing protein